MKIQEITGGELPTNAYFITDEATGDCALIDPGFYNHELQRLIQQAGTHFKMILLTHGHWDHIAGVAQIQKETGAQVFIYEDDCSFLWDASRNLSEIVSGKQLSSVKDYTALKDGNIVSVGETKLRVMHTPGHTGGSCCFIGESVIFSGDTLFLGSAGRTDLPTGSFPQIQASLHHLMQLEGDFTVYPGHGDATTLEFERQHNPFV